MLDQATKRKLDSARQILVGKVPDPKAQVEQITTALIYKFMDDMDKENEEVGLKTQFFVKEWNKYSWTKLLDNKLSGQERLDLYVQAITNMPKNPHIPQLFRNIFKGAFLPYNDPRTLSLFLKEINEFNYEHSENLGNAFEYLLSILGSQGDAGQFRTPRHIIDFIVEVVDPKKNETILDPACGTAGFLISAYKHILKNNDGKDNKTGKLTKNETRLTPDDKNRLMNNLTGYDISDDMVKLSLVNMYLHGSPDPKIYVYDTLSSEKRWDDIFDVIMANPPFMTPKGGIVPHKRFSIQANRAEVLFVDYIVEHLTIKGRAGIIVPEGIIFKGEGAYKQLRKKLIEDGLFAVVSLPSGVFNPYSGVKTSILFFDNQLSKKAKDILFIKIENDGFDLGAQRRKIDKDDLPLALEIIKKYCVIVETGLKPVSTISVNIPKSQIAENSDYNLSGDRYKEVINFVNQKWPMVELGDVVEILDNKRKPITKSDRKSGQFPYYGATGILDYVHDYIFDERLVLIGEDGAKWNIGDKTAFIAEGKYWVNNHAHVVRPIKDKLIDIFLVSYLNNIDLSPFITGVTVPKLNQEKLRSIKIPLPPIEVQKEIVEQIEVKQNAIDHAKAIIQNLERERRYFGQALRKLEGVEWVEFDAIIKTIAPPKKIQKSSFSTAGKYPIIDQSQNEIAGWTDDERALIKNDKPVVVFGDHTCSIKYSEIPFAQGADGIKILTTNEKLLPRFLFFFLKTGVIEISGYKRHFSRLQEIKIPLPSLEIQKKLVAEAEKEQEVINANKGLIEIMERKIENILKEI